MFNQFLLMFRFFKRFTEIMKMKSPKSRSTQESQRADQGLLTQASAKNKRLAEQMSRRSGLDASEQTVSVKNRLGAAQVPTKSRLGVAPRVSSGFRGGRGGAASRIGSTSWTRGGTRGRGGGGFQRGGMNRGGRRNFQGDRRGRGATRGGRGAMTSSKVSKEDLDTELDSYMKVGKKVDEISW